MAKNDLLGLDDDDLLLLDPDSGEFLSNGAAEPEKETPARAARPASPIFDDDDEDDDADDEEEEKPKKAKKEKKKKKRSKSSYKGAVIFLIILLILILAAAAILYRLHMVGGDWNKFLPFQIGTQQELTVDTAEEEPVVEEEPVEEEPVVEEPVEEEPVAEEPAEEEPAEEEPAEEKPVEEEPIEEPEETAEEVDPNSFEGMAVTQLLPNGEIETDKLVQVNNAGVEQADGTHILNKDAAAAANELITAAKKDGYSLMLSTCYRDQESFDEDRSIDDLEHSTGIVLDIVSVDHQVPLDFAQNCTKEVEWLTEHAADYGFVLRYPSDKTDTTGHDYMAYHFVYVGKDIAAEMKENGWCLEEYLENVTAASADETADAAAPEETGEEEETTDNT